MLFFGYFFNASNATPGTRMDDGWTEHTGCPVHEGKTWAAIMWYREGVTAEKGWEYWSHRGREGVLTLYPPRGFPRAGACAAARPSARAGRHLRPGRPPRVFLNPHGMRGVARGRSLPRFHRRRTFRRLKLKIRRCQKKAFRIGKH